MRVRDAMATTISCVSPGGRIETAARAMHEEDAGFLPVVEGGGLVGVLSHGNLVQATGGAGPGREATTGVTRGA